MRYVRRSIGRLVVAVALLAAAPGLLRAELVINEALYDPVGADSGKEFVEIANTGPFAAPLEGLAIEAGNGAREDSWEIVWEGRATAAIPPGGFYRIGLDGPGLGEPADLRLQNGPDGVRLVKQGLELDRLGWGDLVHPEYYEGHPADHTRSGHSLARRSDGADTDDNRADFEEVEPSPGRPNRPPVDWAVRIGSVTPEIARPGRPVLLRIEITNRGLARRFPPAVEVQDPSRPVSIGWSGALAPGATAIQEVELLVPTGGGSVLWRARSYGGDPVPENDLDSVRVQIGVGPVRMVEILASPDAEGCEWIELETDLPDRSLLDRLVLEVRDRRLLLAARSVGPATRIGLVAEDSTALRRRFPILSPDAVWPYSGSWPRLRDGDRRAGTSDTLRLYTDAGIVTEVAIPGPAPARGVSLERLHADLPEGPAVWVPCTDPDGATPGRTGPIGTSEPADAPLTVHPRIVDPGSDPCILEGTVGSVPGEVRLDLVDLHGRTVRCLLRDRWVAGRFLATWDGRDEGGGIVEPGIYVAVLQVTRSGGEPERSRTALAVTAGRDR